MRYCKKCVMPDTRPGILFNEDGVCSGCISSSRRNSVNWYERMKELIVLCDKYRSDGGRYDCIITVSGGKDSIKQIDILTRLGMHPLLLNIFNFSWTSTGWGNFLNMSELGYHIQPLLLSRKAAKKMYRIAFEEWGAPCWYWDRAVYSWPITMAMNMGIKLIVYGENISNTYGGVNDLETPSAKEQIYNGCVRNVEDSFWFDKGITAYDLLPLKYPTKEEIDLAELEPIYLSYYIPWSGYQNHIDARFMGFKTLDDTGEGFRAGFAEQYDQIDSWGYLVHPWMKWPKFGHARVTDVCSNLIRDGIMTRGEAIEWVRMQEGVLDEKILNDFCSFTGYTKYQFWRIVDRFYNRQLFRKEKLMWRLNSPIWEQ